MVCLNVEYCRALSERQAGPVNGGGIRDHRGGVHLAPSVAERLFNYGHIEGLLLLVREVDVGITGIDVEEGGPDEDHVEFARDIGGIASKRFGRHSELGSMSETLLDQIRDRKRLPFIHSAVGGGVAAVDYDMESRGTRTLISLLISALEALSRGSLLVIDELDTSLHPDLARAFVALFSKEDSNPHGAQLVFSTHDVTLLGSGLIRQDEIWVTDKSHEGVCRLAMSFCKKYASSPQHP